MFEVRIKDPTIYPCDFSASDYFTYDNFELDTLERANDFIQCFNKHNAGRYAYIWED